VVVDCLWLCLLIRTLQHGASHGEGVLPVVTHRNMETMLSLDWAQPGSLASLRWNSVPNSDCLKHTGLGQVERDPAA